MLDSTRLNEIFRDSLFTNEEAEQFDPDVATPPDSVVVEGVIHNYAFHAERLHSHDQEIAAMIDCLPNEFFTMDDGGGGGGSFLNLCLDRDGRQWTGFHRTQEQLLVLAIGLDRAKIQLPPPLWASLPGGMPYIEFYKHTSTPPLTDGDLVRAANDMPEKLGE